MREPGENLCTINVTSLWNHVITLHEMKGCTYGIAEAAISHAKAERIKAQAKSLGMTLVLSGSDSEQTRTGAGVGILAKAPATVRKLTMNSCEGDDAHTMGRFIKGVVQGTTGLTYTLMVLYGWQGADKDEEKANRTNSLVVAARLEEKTAPKTAVFITGDLNASIHTLPALQDALECGDWFDVGAIPHLRREWNNMHKGEEGDTRPGRRRTEQVGGDGEVGDAMRETPGSMAL